MHHCVTHDPPDLRAYAGQFRLDFLIAAVDVINAVDHGLAARGQAASTSDALARRSEAITPAPVRSRGPGHDGLPPFQPDIGAHARQFLRMHETVFENGLDHDGDALAPASSAPCTAPADRWRSRDILRWSRPRSAAVSGAQICTRSASVCVTSAPACRSLATSAPRCSGTQSVIIRSPPVMAPAIRNVPASMRSAMMVWSAPCSFSTPLDVNGGACPRPRSARPSSRAGAHRSATSGSRAALREHGLAARQHGRHDQILGAGHRDPVEMNVAPRNPSGASASI